MGSNVVQSVIDSMPGMFPGQPVPAAPVAQPVPPPAYTGPAPGSFGYARDRAFDQAGQDFNRGNYLAAAGGALRGVGNAIPAEVEGAYRGLTNLAAKPFGDTPVAAPPLNKDGSYPGLAGLAVGAAQNFMPMAHAGQEFARGVTGAPAPSPMLPEFSQQVQPPRPAAFPSDAPMLMPTPSFGPTNRDVIGASLQAHQSGGVVGHHDWGNGNADVQDIAASARGGLPGGPTTNAWYDHVNKLLTGHGVTAGNRIFDAAIHRVPFSEIAAATPRYDAEARTGQQPVRMLDPTGRHLYTDEGNQPQGRGGPVQGAIATQQPVSNREAFYQTLPPHMAAAIRTGNFSRDQVVHLLGQVAPQMTHEHDPVWVGKNASANALAGMANLTAHGVTEDKNGNVVVDPRTLQLPADRLRALGADPANGDVASQLSYQYNVHKRTNSIWSQFFNSIIPLMQQGQGQ